MSGSVDEKITYPSSGILLLKIAAFKDFLLIRWKDGLAQDLIISASVRRGWSGQLPPKVYAFISMVFRSIIRAGKLLRTLNQQGLFPQ